MHGSGFEALIQGKEPAIRPLSRRSRSGHDAGEGVSLQDAVGRDAAEIAASAALTSGLSRHTGRAGLLPPLLPGAQPSLTWPITAPEGGFADAPSPQLSLNAGLNVPSGHVWRLVARKKPMALVSSDLGRAEIAHGKEAARLVLGGDRTGPLVELALEEG